MAAAPMDMLRKCREVFASRAEENRIVAADIDRPEAYRGAAAYMAEENDRLVAEIDATLREWG